MKRIDWARLVPPGSNGKQECLYILWLLGGCACFSFGALLRYSDAYNRLFRYDSVRRVRILIAGAVMPDFVDILGNGLLGFAVAAVCMLALAVWHYACHFRGSKSIYLMRRLPRRWELACRCLALPLAGVAACLLAAVLLLLIYFAVYQLATPAQCLTGDQWRKLWDAWRGIRP